METFKLWLEDDPDIPSFKKLAWDIVEVDIRDVLEQGVHPFEDRSTTRTLIERFLQLFNEDQFKIPELTDLSYCEPITNYGHHHYGHECQFEELLKRINQSVRFVDRLGFQQMSDLARQHLRHNWEHKLVRQLVGRIYYNFNDMRSFIKSKSKKVKLRSYEDLDSYDLAAILTLEDFEAVDKVLISEGLPVTNFRSATFLSRITDQRGLLRMVKSIDDFELLPPNGTGYGYTSLIYRGKRQQQSIALTPTLTDSSAMRAQAQETARRWRTNDGAYCFTTSISKLSEMLTDGGMQIRFPRLDYVRKRDPGVSIAHFSKSELTRNSIGGFVTARCSGDTIKGILRRHRVPMTGTKDKLLEKLAKLACQRYYKQEEEMENFFQQNRFIKVAGSHHHQTQQFPILSNCELRNLLITIYALKHLRGNAILDATYENDTFDLQALAQSLVNEEVNLSGSFLSVEN